MLEDEEDEEAEEADEEPLTDAATAAPLDCEERAALLPLAGLPRRPRLGRRIKRLGGGLHLVPGRRDWPSRPETVAVGFLRLAFRRRRPR